MHRSAVVALARVSLPIVVCGVLLNPALTLSLRGQDSDLATSIAKVDFEESVLPILQTHCIDCHNDSIRMGHLVLETRKQMLDAEVVEKGDAAESLLIQRLHDRDLGILMPPTGRLSKKERATLEAWINEGADWPSGVELDVNQTPMSHLPFIGVFELLRNGDNERLANVELTKELLSSTDRHGATPLAYASQYGNAEAVAFLLENGAHPNVADHDGITPLILAVQDAGKVRLLLDHGADVSAKTKLGRNALIIAAAHSGSRDVVQALLDAGADVSFADRRGWMPLSLAARTGDRALVSLLWDAMESVPDAKRKSALEKALSESARANDFEMVRMLVDQDELSQEGLDTSLVFAATHGNLEMARLLIDTGASRQATQSTNYGTPASPFLASTYAESTNPKVVALMLEEPFDFTTKERHGKTAWIMACERRDEQIVEILEKAGGAGDGPSIKEENQPTVQSIAVGTDDAGDISRPIIQKSIALLQSADPIFFAKSGCVACHQQTSSQLVVAGARPLGFEIDDQVLRQQIKLTAVELAKKRASFLQRIKSGGAAHRFGYLLWGLSKSGYEPDEYTDATYHELVGLQRADGSWFSDAHRPPTEYSPVSATAVALRAVKHYAPPGLADSSRQRVARATKWLETQDVRLNAEKAFRLLGLLWGGAENQQLRQAVQSLLADQRDDGGWSQTPHLVSDAYATGLSLYALAESGQVSTEHPSYKKGTEFLLGNAFPDGSWHVASRSFKFQPYFESGFPHGEDQWISAAATGWATLALMRNLEPISP